MSEPELDRLIVSAQKRNVKEGITGLLIYDQGRFLQWLEGPTEGVGRVWQSISQDRRHDVISVLGESSLPVRCFGSSAMALGKRRAEVGSNARRPADVGLPPELIEALYRSPHAAPSVLAALAPRPQANALRRAKLVSVPSKPGKMSLRGLINEVIVPQLVTRHAKSLVVPIVIDTRTGELARLLLAADPDEAFALIDTLRADGRTLTQLCTGLLEPAGRALGDLWLSDDCTEFEATLGMGHLQRALRRVSGEALVADAIAPPLSVPHAVLVVPTPREPHLLGSMIASEMFWRAGWDVHCEFPDSDEALGRLVHDRWFDVLDLSLSGAFAREHRLPAMAASIRAAHAHSLNPALTVIVDGRVFHEQPGAYADVGADAGMANAQDIAMTALRHARLAKP